MAEPERARLDPYVRILGEVTDLDDVRVGIGVDYDAITVGPHRFTGAQIEELVRLIVQATWQAGQQKRRMDEEIHEADGGDTQEHVSFPLHARYAYPDAGWPADREEAAERLTAGEVYTIRYLEVGGSTSYFGFQEVGGRYNTVLFEPVADDA